MPKTHRFQSPLKHWISGLLWELVGFAAYVLVVALALAAVVLIERQL